jgi:hypothetical protein
VCILLQLFQRIQNQHEILRFVLSFLIFFILALFETLKPKAQKTAQKIKKRI